MFGVEKLTYLRGAGAKDPADRLSAQGKSLKREGEGFSDSYLWLLTMFLIVSVLYLHTNKHFQGNICGTNFAGGGLGSTCCSFKAGHSVVLIVG